MSHINRIPGSSGEPIPPHRLEGNPPPSTGGAGAPTHASPPSALAGLPVQRRQNAGTGNASFVSGKTGAEQKALAKKLAAEAEGIKHLTPDAAAVEFDRILRATDGISAEYAVPPLHNLAGHIDKLPEAKRSQAFDSVLDKAEAAFSAGRISSSDYKDILNNLSFVLPSLPENHHSTAVRRLFGQISRLRGGEQNLPLAMIAARIPNLAESVRYPTFRVVLSGVNRNGSNSPLKAAALYGLAASPEHLPENVRSSAFLEASHGIKMLSLDEQPEGIRVLLGQFGHLAPAGQAPALHSILDAPVFSPSNIAARGVPPDLGMVLPQSVSIGANLSPEHRFFVIDKAANSIAALPADQQAFPVYALAAHAKFLAQPEEKAATLRRVINSESLAYENLSGGVSQELYAAMWESANQISTLNRADRFEIFAAIGKRMHELPENDRQALYTVLADQFKHLSRKEKVAVRNFIIRRTASNSISQGADVQTAVSPFRRTNRKTTNYLNAFAAVCQGVPPEIAAQQFRVEGELRDELRKETAKAAAAAAGRPQPSI